MKHHKYFNCIWTERDQEFWWDGIKSGFIVSMVLTSVLWAGIITFVDSIKNT